MDLKALRDEIVKAAYNGKTNAEIASELNSKTVTRSRVVPTWEVKKQAIEQGYWAAIVMASEPANSNQQVRGLAISALAWLDDPKIETIDFGLASTQTLVGGLVQTTLITQAQGDSLIALGAETVSYASTIGGTTITADDIRDAKGRQ